MPLHLQVDHVGAGLDFDTGTNTLSAITTETIVYAGRYLDGTSSTDNTASFIDADTNTNGAWTLNLRDVDHAAGMHYWIRVDVGASALTIQREGGSTKTINGTFKGAPYASATSLALLLADGILRLRPDGADWSIY